MKLFVVCLCFAAAAGAASALTGFPFTDETLSYRILGPTGIRLGEAHLDAKHAAAGWEFELKADAGTPGFAIQDVYSSRINSDFCSTSFTRRFLHGSHKGREEETVERSSETVTRSTISGGIGRGGDSDFAAPDCVKDALTMLYYARRELGQGRVPRGQSMLFGGLYDIGFVYGGAQTISIADKPVVTDKITCTVKGPASRVDFEIYFARDPARTPLLVKLPLLLGSFSLELVH